MIEVIADLESLPWRIGRHVGRTIYAQTGTSAGDVLIGVMDTVELATVTCADHNRAIGSVPLSETVAAEP